MIKLRYGYLFLGIVMGLVLLWQFITTLPDGKLHITVCDVGQGDATYLRFPDGRDMLVDGGPGSKVLLCLGKLMPFWDRHIDAVVLTHPDLDHFQGLIEVIKRYRVGVFVKSDISNSTALFAELEKERSGKNIPVRSVTSHEKIYLGNVTLDVLWPAQAFLLQTSDVLGSDTDGVRDISSVQTRRNDYGVVFHLRYGMFDAVFTGDADQRVEPYYTGEYLSPDGIEFLKVPHHGSRTGMTDAFVSWLHPEYAVISVGAKNSYGHPSQHTLQQLKDAGATVFRTDQNGSISLHTDGRTLSITKEKENRHTLK